MKSQNLIIVIGIIVSAGVCAFDRNLTFVEKVSLLWVAVFSVRVFRSGERPLTESMRLQDFYLAVVLVAVLSAIGALAAL